MVAAVGIDAPEGRLLAALRASAADINAPAGTILAAYNVPSDGIAGPQAEVKVTFQGSGNLEVPQAYVLAAVKGRARNPKLRVWTFNLDGHDFYVLRLGDDDTLVYDVYSQKWVDWDSGLLEFWRANVGQNWLGGSQYGPLFGSNILVGDDTFGLLWLLDPATAQDEDPILERDEAQPFTRVVTGQVVVRGNDVAPCFSVYLTTEFDGQPAETAVGVDLQISDDAGSTYSSAGTITCVLGQPTEFIWRSLGQVVAPGRLFRFVDDGAVQTIVGMDMNEPENGDSQNGQS